MLLASTGHCGHEPNSDPLRASDGRADDNGIGTSGCWRDGGVPMRTLPFSPTTPTAVLLPAMSIPNVQMIMSASLAATGAGGETIVPALMRHHSAKRRVSGVPCGIPFRLRVQRRSGYPAWQCGKGSKESIHCGSGKGPVESRAEWAPEGVDRESTPGRVGPPLQRADLPVPRPKRRPVNRPPGCVRNR